ncbi:ribosome maturation factor RimM [Microbaculum marinum]|uniref:Ribosome maturation factor RimM n=1 Tax=Microbaculum marinum TaxID=1764581 RepID=A0AAW9S4V0_9HYPH
MTGKSNRVCVGVVGAPHGVRGEVRIKSETADPLDIAAYGPLSTEDGRTLTIRSVRPAKGVVVASIEGITDRDAAETLKNRRLYVDRDRLPEPDEDEWYHADLVGLSAVGVDGAKIGTVTAVQDFGGGDLLEVALSESRRTVFVPFNRTVVPDVDIAAGRLIVDPPDGLLDEDEDER